jgi:glucose-6-phosphate 1-dehydrogenase
MIVFAVLIASHGFCVFQPDEAVYLKMNIKSPGLRSRPMQAELDVTYKSRFEVL